MSRQNELVGVQRTRLFRVCDERGSFLEAWRPDTVSGCPDFQQDNLSWSSRGVLRGLHFQDPAPQGKLVIVVQGSIFDVVVDLRPASPTFGHWQGCLLESSEGVALWVPPGLAHGFYVPEGEAIVLYKCTTRYQPGGQHVLAWDDSDLAIEWPVPPGEQPVLSERDASGRRWREIKSGLS
jgi:dTDP-4-dehydrorhamnose 3,5-epimerase